MLNQKQYVGDKNIPGIFVSTKDQLKKEWELHGKRAVYLTDRPEIVCDIKIMDSACIFMEKKGRPISYEADYIWQMTEDTDLPDEFYIHRIWQRHMHIPWKIVETEHLLIRESVMEDLPYFQKYYEEEADNMDVQDLGVGEKQLYSYIAVRYPLFEYGLWSVVDKSTGTVIGRAGIEELPEQYGNLAGEPELSYLIGRKYRRRGYASESCRAILRYAAEELEMDRIYLRTSKDNFPSQKLAEKLGLLKVESITEYKDLLYCGLLTFEE